VKYIESSSIGAISSVLGGPPRVSGAGIFSMLFGFGRKKGLTKAQRKKLARRRYRTFVDNIVMHHKRLHDKNREITINLAKAKTPIKPKEQKLQSILTKDNQTRWRDQTSARERTLKLRGRVDARRTRARSRWVSIVSDRKDASGESRVYI
jgi:hypothetical protein